MSQLQGDFLFHPTLKHHQHFAAAHHLHPLHHLPNHFLIPVDGGVFEPFEHSEDFFQPLVGLRPVLLGFLQLSQSSLQSEYLGFNIGVYDVIVVSVKSENTYTSVFRFDAYACL